jgi:prepilin-type N-terminal cleavage/methylation domain-containing protein
MRRLSARPGFSLLELLIALTLGVVVIGVTSTFAVGTWRSDRTSRTRDELNRDARFIGMAMSRDLQDAGVAFASTQEFGSIAARNDTVMALSVPYEPDVAPTYSIVAAPDTNPLLPPGGTCGALCIEFRKVDDQFRIAAGDVARLQVQGERRLAVVESVEDYGSTVYVHISGVQQLFVYPAAFADSLRLHRSATTLQKVTVSAWYYDPATQNLMRASGFDGAGHFRAVTAAASATNFQARLRFMDGVERANANGFDTDTLNDYDRITAVRVRATLRSRGDSTLLRGAAPAERVYEWRVTPRNLMYERNRAL